MKRDIFFSIAWCVISYIMQFAFWSFSIFIKNMAEEYSSTGILLNKFGVPLAGYIVLGLLIGILALNIRYYSKVSRLVTLSFALYLVLKIPFMMVSDLYSYIYPSWMMLYIRDTTTWFGGIVISIIIINVWCEKLSLLKD